MKELKADCGLTGGFGFINMRDYFWDVIYINPWVKPFLKMSKPVLFCFFGPETPLRCLIVRLFTASGALVVLFFSNKLFRLIVLLLS